jgi:hypothetical protein
MQTRTLCYLTITQQEERQEGKLRVESHSKIINHIYSILQRNHLKVVSHNLKIQAAAKLVDLLTLDNLKDLYQHSFLHFIKPVILPLKLLNNKT